MEYSGSVFKWRDGWYVKVVEDGKRRNLRLAKTKSEAQTKLDSLKSQQAKADEKDRTDYPFLHLCDGWLVMMQNRLKQNEVSPSFVSSREAHVRHFLKWRVLGISIARTSHQG